MTERILLVDDDPDLLLLEQTLLEAGGREIVLAPHGASALANLRTADFDVVVSDLEMPGLNGLQLLDQMKDVAPEAVFVMCTSHGQLDVAVKALRAGAFDFVTKPFALDHFTSVIDRALSHRRLRDATDVYRASQVVFTTLDPNDLPKVILETAMRVGQADWAAIHDGQRLVHETGVYKPPAATLATIASRSVELATATEAARYPGDATTPHALAWPLSSGRRSHGVLWALRKPHRRPFGARDADLLSVLAAQASLAIDNLRLVTALRERIDALERARRRVYTSARAEAVGRMAVDVANQLQNPLDYARSHLREVERYFGEIDLPDPEVSADQASRRLRDALEGLDRVSQMAGDLSSVAQGRHQQRFELSQAVQLAVRMVRVRSRVDVDVAEDAAVTGNAGDLAQALVAVLVNAEQAMGSQPEPRIGVRVSLEGKRARVAIEDNGEGIAPENLPLVGKLFFSTRGRDGLGLNSAREILERHEGRFEVTSVVGQGTRVVIDLPGEPVEEEVVGEDELVGE